MSRLIGAAYCDSLWCCSSWGLRSTELMTYGLIAVPVDLRSSSNHVTLIGSHTLWVTWYHQHAAQWLEWLKFCFGASWLWHLATWLLLAFWVLCGVMWLHVGSWCCWSCWCSLHCCGSYHSYCNWWICCGCGMLQALYLLLQCGHDIDEAVHRHKLQSVTPSGFGTFFIILRQQVTKRMLFLLHW